MQWINVFMFLHCKILIFNLMLTSIFLYYLRPIWAHYVVFMQLCTIFSKVWHKTSLLFWKLIKSIFDVCIYIYYARIMKEETLVNKFYFMKCFYIYSNLLKHECAREKWIFFYVYMFSFHFDFPLFLINSIMRISEAP